MNENKKINILMIAPDPNRTLGGMSTVIKNYENAGLSDKVNYKFIPSTKDGGAIGKILLFAIAIIRVIYSFMFTEVDIVHIHSASRGSFKRKSLLVNISKIFGKKVILHLHGAEFNDFYENECSPKQKINVKKTFYKCDTVIVLGQEWKSKISKYCDAHIEVLNNAIEVPKENLYSTNSNKITVLGRLGHRKGTFDIIKVAKELSKQYPKTKIILAGDGDIELVKSKIIEENLSENIDVLGWVNEEKRCSILKDTKIYILPSYNEGMPMSILEAISYGIPVISTNVGSIPTVIENSVNGYIIEAGDTDSLFTKIKELIDNDKKRSTMSNNNYKKAKERFSIESNIDALMKIYRKLIIS